MHHDNCSTSLYTDSVNTCKFPTSFVHHTSAFFMQLTVLVTPGLPPGIGYQCSFSAIGALVPAIEVVNGTEYICDLNTVPALTSLSIKGLKMKITIVRYNLCLFI